MQLVAVTGEVLLRPGQVYHVYRCTAVQGGTVMKRPREKRYGWRVMSDVELRPSNP